MTGYGKDSGGSKDHGEAELQVGEDGKPQGKVVKGDDRGE